MKKLLLALGTITAVATPVAAVVACGTSNIASGTATIDEDLYVTEDNNAAPEYGGATNFGLLETPKFEKVSKGEEMLAEWAHIAYDPVGYGFVSITLGNANEAIAAKTAFNLHVTDHRDKSKPEVIDFKFEISNTSDRDANLKKFIAKLHETLDSNKMVIDALNLSATTAGYKDMDDVLMHYGTMKK